MSKNLQERLKKKILMLRLLEKRQMRLEHKLDRLIMKNNVIRRYEAMIKLYSHYSDQLRNIEASTGQMIISNASEDGELYI